MAAEKRKEEPVLTINEIVKSMREAGKSEKEISERFPANTLRK